jgi:hypothetical protein
MVDDNMKNGTIPELLWTRLEGKNLPLLTEPQITVALEHMRLRGLSRLQVYTLSESANTVQPCGSLYSDCNGLVLS